MNKKEQEAQESKDWLKNHIKPSDALIIVQKSVSASGMLRKMKLYVGKNTDSLMDITYHAAKALGWGYSDGLLRVGGCGMDMHFHTADSLTHAIYDYDESRKMAAKGKFKGNGGSCLDWISL